ncbi:MAG: hypothetical protein PWR10_1581 [Halanaerobiales bacterium]|nr:hypothetical protein [Halanaerobiales bacterium]
MASPFHTNRRLIAEIFEDLVTEVIEELVFLEDFQNLNPDVRTLSNISSGSSTTPTLQNRDLNQR